MFSYGFPLPAPPPAASPLESDDVTLLIRQQPKEAQVTSEGKEKARKPVDPPPIVQLKVRHEADPQSHFLQSPYLFLCVSLWQATQNEPHASDGKATLAGTLVSSIHRLKDNDNRDGGYFVFGDVSAKILGTHRLHFSLFDLRKGSNEVVFLKSITSEPFRVLAPKDFKGMEESTYLSRAFSDQGVRLRLRKESRAMAGYGSQKRRYPYSTSESREVGMSASAMGKPTMSDHYGSMYSDDGTRSPAKRQRSSGEPEDDVQSGTWERNAQLPDRPDSTIQGGYPQTHLSLRQHHMYSDYSSQLSPTQQFGTPLGRQPEPIPFSYRVPSSAVSYPSSSASYPTNPLMPPLGGPLGQLPSPQHPQPSPQQQHHHHNPQQHHNALPHQHQHPSTPNQQHPQPHRFPDLNNPYQQAYGGPPYGQLRGPTPSQPPTPYNFGEDTYDRYRTDLGNVPEGHDNT